MSTKRTYVGVATKLCEKCGAAVTRKHSAFREHVFCSQNCYLTSDFHVQRTTASNLRRFEGRRAVRPCRHCGAEVERAISQFRLNTFCSVACRRAYALTGAPRQINARGYALRYVGVGYPGADKAGKILEHRKVMQDHLGRTLLPQENVHHINGDRADNRLENLELWNESQPPGQRVEEKLAWAREIVALYGGVDL